MNQKPDLKNYTQILSKITEANTKKQKAKVDSANARLELSKLKEELLKAGALEQLGVDFFVHDVDCW
jgi:hypothetical protein